MHLVGCGDLDAPLPRERHGIFDFTDRRDSPCGCPLSAQPIQGYSNCNLLIISFYFATHSNQRMYTTRVSAFSFYLKKKTPAKEKQTQGYAPRPRQRRAAVHSLWLSTGGSAHSHANALELERVRARASCYASRSLAFPSQTSNTVARLLEA